MGAQRWSGVGIDAKFPNAWTELGALADSIPKSGAVRRDLGQHWMKELAKVLNILTVRLDRTQNERKNTNRVKSKSEHL
jgi:hypothetical protein